jgi:hypothetical protein
LLKIADNLYFSYNLNHITMKRLPFLLLFLIPIVFAGCSTAGAEKIADEFHQKLDEGDHDYIINQLADIDGNATTED